MNRYTYKAKRKDNGEWVYGFYNYIFAKYDYSEKRHIIMGYDEQGLFFEDKIMPETLCQCTGLQDTEGNYIFENDIVNIYFKKTNVLNAIAEVIYKDYSFKLETPGYILADHNWEEDLKIIGNKFDEVK